jgi:TonB-linked SusC/RagA family outer membrane protein
MKTTLKICCFLTALILSVTGSAWAQGTQRIVVQGKVIDAKTKETIIGASVLELDKDKRIVRGVSTDINGNYALQFSNPNNMIQVTFIGYTTILQSLQGRTVINFSLVSSENTLEDVAITGRRTVNNGTGLNIDARNSTFSTASVKAKDLEELSATSIDQALQGRLPGVDVAATSGNPGAGMSIRIRGTSNLNGSADPMIVLDGVPYETQIPEDFNFSTADEQGYAQLLNIAPSDISEITVLKDAASTAIWGARAANGVLVITTKRGVIGKPTLNYTLTMTRQQQPKTIPLLSGDQYSNLIPEEFSNRNTPLAITTPEFLYDPLQPTSFYNYNKNTNWLDAISRVGLIQGHSLSISGGGEKARYYVSVGYNNNKGTTVGTNLNRVTSKINLDYNVSNRIRFKSDFTYTNLMNEANYSNPNGVAYNKMPNMAIYQFDEFGNQTPNFFSPASNIQGQYSSTYNPLAFATLATSKQYGERITPHFQLQYDILPSNVLMATFDVQFDVNNTKVKNFLPQTATGRPITETTSNRATDNDGDSYDVGTRFNLIFNKSLYEDLTLQSVFSFQTSDSQNNGQSITTSNLASPNLTDPSNPGRTQNGDLTLSSSNSRSRDLGLVTTNQFSFLDRYLVNFGGRLVGNAKMAPDNRYRFFPSVSVRYRFSGEPFMKDIKWMDDLSFRYSYGESAGIPGGNYLFYNTYVPSPANYLGLTGVVPGNIGLDNLQYQITGGTNAGANLRMLKSRLILDLDFYRNRIRKLIFNGLVIPDYTGYTSVSSNVGVMVNKGFEVNLNTVPYRSKDLVVNVDFNIAQNNNVIESVSEYYPRTDGKQLTNGNYRSYLQPGNPFGSFYGFRYKGVYTDLDATIARDKDGNKVIGPNGQVVYMRYGFPATDYTFQPGDAMYDDINHDGNINEDDVVYLGNGTPKISGGFGAGFTYKGSLTLQSFFTFKSGYELINSALMTTTNMYGYNNQSTIVLQRWRNPGDVTSVPRALYQSGYNWLGSDRYVSSASFVRLKQLTARYRFTPSFLEKVKMKNASLFVTFENLYTWTSYKGVDPDVGARGPNNPFSFVKDDNLTPPSKNILFGLVLGF